MENYFTRHEPFTDRILFVLALDRKKMKERIIIGSQTQIRARLKGIEDTDILYDAVHPLGSFLIGFENDPENEWNSSALMPLYNALHVNRWKQPELEQTAAAFLLGKYQKSDPACQYTAIRIWNSYLAARQYRERDAASLRFLNSMGSLISAFHGNSPMSFDKNTGKPVRYDISRRLFGSVPAEDTRLDLWYPDNRRMTMECVSAYDSFYPLLIYYTNRLADWNLHFCRCKVCGKIFLAGSLRYELCSDPCRKTQALQNKREFDARARENNYDLLYKNECQNWRNKINRAKRIGSVSSIQLEEIQSAFSAFKKEALQRKRLVKDKKSSPKEFTDWLYGQSSVITDLLEET